MAPFYLALKAPPLVPSTIAWSATVLRVALFRNTYGAATLY